MVQVMRLSKNFSLDEMVHSPAALIHHIHNIPNAEQIENMRALALNILQPIRDHFGPFKITSGFRSKELNALIGGSPTSQHTKGQAADFTIEGVQNDTIWHYVIDSKLPFDQLILERVPVKDKKQGWIHVSYSPAHRRDARSSPSPGVYVKGLKYAE